MPKSMLRRIADAIDVTPAQRRDIGAAPAKKVNTNPPKVRLTQKRLLTFAEQTGDKSIIQVEGANPNAPQPTKLGGKSQGEDFRYFSDGSLRHANRAPEPNISARQRKKIVKELRRQYKKITKQLSDEVTEQQKGVIE